VNRKFSAVIGIVGGIIDLAAGWALLQSVQSMMPITMTRPEMTIIIRSQALWLAYFLIGLGVVVFITSVYLLVSRMMRHVSSIGWLMILYGVTMLFLGVGMIGQLLAMMQRSLFSGSVMIIVGMVMLYSGYGMVRMK
jgi:hypothetical protein